MQGGSASITTAQVSVSAESIAVRAPNTNIDDIARLLHIIGDANHFHLISQAHQVLDRQALDDPNRICYWTLLVDVFNQCAEYPYENAVKDDERFLSVKDHLVEINPCNAERCVKVQVLMCDKVKLALNLPTNTNIIIIIKPQT